MADGYEVRGDIEELRAHFDEPKAIEQFKSGELLAWLEARYYDTIAGKIRELMQDYEDQERANMMRWGNGSQKRRSF